MGRSGMPERDAARAPMARGLRDVLPVEATDRRRIVGAALDVMERAGYAEVCTPTFERYEDLVRGSGEGVAGQVFRFFDADGTLMALRPEMTTPIARLVGQRLADEPGPVRLCYAAPVFREAPTLMGQAREFTQIGAELVDGAGPDGDAEVLTVAARVAEAAGVPDAVLAVGRVDLIRALLDGAGVATDEQAPMLAALGSGDLVTFEGALARASGSGARAGEALRELVRLDGEEEVMGRARELAGRAGAGILDGLAEMLAAVRDRLGRLPVRLHFGMVRSFDYYTGLVFEVVASGVGTALGGGGRYDRLLAEFGPDRPAAGFAYGLERLMQAAAARGVFSP